jgi:DNA helicase-2/ATP-dependent DNA helicase PcrA
MPTSELLANLNDAQREAVAAPLTSVLVLAGAGSGKTRVLVQRMAWLIDTEGFSPRSLLAVTFTNKAARQIRERLAALLHEPVEGLWVGTFHGLTHRMLRQHWQLAGLPQQFQILDSEDQLRLLRRLLRELELDEAHWPARQAQWFINQHKEKGQRPDQVTDDGNPVERQWLRVYTVYEKACARSGLVDFAELLLRALELLRDHPALLEQYRARFQQILVDEFQDTNDIQYQWLHLLAGSRGLIFAVGDDDQSIYGWRGAKVENLRRLQRDFPDTRLIRLEQNYRSSANILRAANTLIRKNQGRFGKELWTSGQPGAPVRVFAAFNEQEESRFVVDAIAAQVQQGRRYRHCAVLYRSNAQSRVLEESLMRRGMPYRVYGGLRFFDRQEIKDALAYLRLVSNADDDAAFLRVVNQPPRGIGERTLDEVRAAAAEGSCSLHHAARSLVQGQRLAGRTRTAVAGFLQMLDGLRAESVGLELPLLLERSYQRTGLQEHYAQEKGEQAQARLENLRELVGAARGFVLEFSGTSGNEDEERVGELREPEEPVSARREVRGETLRMQEPAGGSLPQLLDHFLAHAALEAGMGSEDPDEDAVQLMTLHAAKGLEFPVVFIVGLEEGLFPGVRSLESPVQLEEERRLAYVGMTRAEEELYLTYAESRRLYGQETHNRPSRFLQELPPESLERMRTSGPLGVMHGYSGGRSAHTPPPRTAGRTGTASLTQNRPAAVVQAQAAAAAAAGLAIGTTVRHHRFGEGVVMEFEGSGASTRVQVRFRQEGMKWLVLGFARLEVVGR